MCEWIQDILNNVFSIGMKRFYYNSILSAVKHEWVFEEYLLNIILGMD